MPTVAEIFAAMSYGPAPEAATPALDWIADHGGRFGHLVDGVWTDPSDLFVIVNPATGRPLAEASQAGEETVDSAVRAARAALASWQAIGGHGRARHLYALARAVQKNARHFAVLESLDNGKPIRESRDLDIPLAARHFAYHAGWAQIAEHGLPGWEAAGVVGQIIPWNFPLLMLAWKVAPALAAGCTVVLKPAEFTPLTALLFAEIAHSAGLPPGVLNVVTGDGRTGELIVRHPDVDKIAFTGSTDVGRIIRKATAGSGKKLSLELGGKSPFVVLDDADLDGVVEGVVDAIWFNQGQVCCAGSRLLVQESIADQLLAKLRARMEKLRVGDPLEKAIDIGAIVAPVQLEKIRTLCELGVEEGAEIWQPSWAAPAEGYWFPPTLFTNVAPAATIAQVEIFGPVLVSMTFRTVDEAVALANNTPYGLAASVWTGSTGAALELAGRIKAGTIWVNCTNQFDAASGFGGYRESGFGREGGREGMFEYLRPAWERDDPPVERPAGAKGVAPSPGPPPSTGLPPIDRTLKLFVGGKQARPDSGYSRTVFGADGTPIAEVGEGNRKDIRNAVEAARAADGWSAATAYNRAQVVYYLAENLSVRADEFARRIAQQTGSSAEASAREVELAIERLFGAAAWADKFGGTVQQTPLKGLVAAVHEPVGVLGIVCPPEQPLLALVSLLGPAIAQGNRVVLIPSEPHPLSATDLYQVLETSDVPAGVVNIVTGAADPLAAVLAAHDDVDGLWYFAGGDRAGVERLSAGNLKRLWVSYHRRDWERHGDGEEFLRRAVEVKNIWIPAGA
ncbi:MAG: aldehyde dehydrogenase family protein [Dehalococcoidia bacterium]